MPLIQLVIVLVVVGVILWLINSYIPMQATIKKILNVVVIIMEDCKTKLTPEQRKKLKEMMEAGPMMEGRGMRYDQECDKNK